MRACAVRFNTYTWTTNKFLPLLADKLSKAARLSEAYLKRS